MHDEHQTNGIVIGVVSSLDDDRGLARIKVRFPHLGGVESDWARLATPMAGPKRGTFFMPEINDEVLVGFEHNDPRRPYILGSLWSQQDQPPPGDGDRKANNWRFIHSRSGHIILLDDTPGKEKIELIYRDGKRRVVIDNSTITVLAQEGNIELKAPMGKVLIEATEVTVRAQQTLNLQGATVNIN
jgi:uncharacterized protein involved in type VI secretion and phage assembly